MVTDSVEFCVFGSVQMDNPIRRLLWCHYKQDEADTRTSWRGFRKVWTLKNRDPDCVRINPYWFQSKIKCLFEFFLEGNRKDWFVCTWKNHSLPSKIMGIFLLAGQNTIVGNPINPQNIDLEWYLFNQR